MKLVSPCIIKSFPMYQVVGLLGAETPSREYGIPGDAEVCNHHPPRPHPTPTPTPETTGTDVTGP